MNVLITDFDGTITQHDFYELVTTRLLPPDTPNHWTEYRSGRSTHFEALQAYFAAIRVPEADVLKLVAQMEVDPGLGAAVAALQQAEWRVVVASAGCRWYIDRLLAAAGVALEVHANPGRSVAGQGLLMDWPRDSPFFSPTHGIDKAGIVRHYAAAGHTVAFAGDGFPDVAAALLVPADRRFARGALAGVLRDAGHAYRPFHVWSEIASALLAGSTTGP